MSEHRQLFLAFTKMQRLYIKRLNERLESLNVSYAQWSVLYYIYSNGPHTISEIAKHQDVEKPTISKVVQKLDEYGYVTGIQGEDKRVKRVTLTPKGQQNCEAVDAHLGAYQQSLAEGFNEEEQAFVRQFIESVTAKL
ncbi:MarR family winged helix-turn-helix transcriptional regulator [Brochothrix thermosphacta]|uniref:MarR family winged helix-turn-helix transcriptional regulator n=1 Tax=Brochothrix thermosphacta TaxID=2756 RepID=UPI00083F8E5A|nr:MarR family transcriptional regulator [Brochothrix thermosphacta]ODJ59298.1 hypothetical protein BFR35_03760 [Brochothrix thermosphacta]ODJ68107.1 hypothetical protein BFR37_04685 [Brochothrix thermosphacta]SPN71010.1 putative Uncharacterized HTH-type transcriptional regulator YwoH [Brochothrix thermosphacta]